MSIVGTQAVSMSDLMKLGPQTLGAMAQGQMQTIAPPYMVLAALKALTDEKAGMQAQVPGQTVKDQVVAQATPPAQAGIGAMAPQPMQKFADGGTVGSYIGRSRGQNLLPNTTGFEGMSIGELLSALADKGSGYLKRAYDAFGDLDSSMKQSVRGAQPTTPTGEGRARLSEAAISSDQEEPLGNEGRREPMPFADRTQPVGMRASASATSRGGLGGMAGPLAKYEKAPNATPSPASFQLDIPKNEQLEAAVKKFSSPDEKRMAELKEAERNAGLGAFAKGILQGRGFGGAFGPAVADSIEAQTARGDKRREYEDARERVATELGIKQGEQARQDFLAKTEYGDKRSDKAREQEMERWKTANQIINYENQAELEKYKISMMAEANRIAAEVRRDGLKQHQIAAIQGLYTKAQELAVAEAEREFGKTDFDPALAQSPQMRSDMEKRQQAKRTRIEQLMSKYIGELESRIGPLTNGIETMVQPQRGVARDYTK